MSATANDVVTKLVSLIEGAAGDAISPAAKSRLELVGKLIGGLSDEFVPMLAAKYDTSALLDAIVKLEDAMIGMEEAGHELAAIFEGKKATATVTATPAATTTAAPASTTEASSSASTEASKEESAKAPF